MTITGKTDVGKVRKVNQDCFDYGFFDDGSAWAIVCDGMGGANGGSVASEMALRHIAEKIRTGYTGADSAAIKKLLAEALNEANAQVFEQSCSQPELFGMGTTVVACIATPLSAYVAHVGDSRAYLITAKGAIQVTRDHSVVQEMVDSGQLTAEEARVHPKRNIITRALGVEQALDIDFCEATLAPENAVLLCSDGFTNHVEPETFVPIIGGSREGDAAEKLVAIANERGGSDNITVVLIRKEL